MNRNEQQMYSDIASIRKSLEKIANALNTPNVVYNGELKNTKDIPGFEGVLNDLDNLYQPTSDNPDPAGYGNKDEYETDGTSVGNGKYEDEYTYDNDLNEYKYVSKVGKIKNDSDFDIRVAAKQYEDEFLANGHTKKECILHYVTNEFGLFGARYTDIIKFCYYLGAPNAPKYTSENRGYYSCAFSFRMNGHLIQGGKDFLVKGINKDGKERYFTHSNVNRFTDYYKIIE